MNKKAQSPNKNLTIKNKYRPNFPSLARAKNDSTASTTPNIS